MDDDETKIYRTEPQFRAKLEDQLLDAMKATDLGVAQDSVRRALRMVGRLRGDDVLISRELALSIQTKFEEVSKVRAAVHIAESRLAKARRRTHADLRSAVLQRDGCRCRYCGLPVTAKDAQIDHWEPDGPTDLGNLVTACRACNIRKSNVTPRMLFRRLGMRLLGGKPETPPTDKVADAAGAKAVEAIRKATEVRQQVALEDKRLREQREALRSMGIEFVPSELVAKEIEALLDAGRAMATPAEVGTWFGISEKDVISAFDDGRLKGIRIGSRTVRINCRALLRLAAG